MSQLRLHEVILDVKNMRTEVEFYRDVLGLTVTYPSQPKGEGNDDWVTFGTGACTLALHSGGNGEVGSDAPCFVFWADDLEQRRIRLQSFGRKVSEIRSPATEVRVFDTTDPEGNRFSVESR